MLGAQKGVVLGSYLRCLLCVKGVTGLVSGSYLRCLGRVRGLKGVNLSSYIYCLGRFRGIKGVGLGSPFCVLKVVRVWTRLGAFGRVWFYGLLPSLFGTF